MTSSPVSEFEPLPRRAYVMSQFPEFCETFILNEIVELGKRGVPFEVFSLKRCRDGHFQPGAEAIMREATHYAPPVLSLAILSAHVAWMFRAPGRYISTLALALRAIRGPWETFLKTLYVFAQAPWFARLAERRGLEHIHAHWASVPASAGLFIARLMGRPFSLTGHAYDLFIDRTLLEEKIRAAEYVVTCTQYNRDFLLKTYPWAKPEHLHAVYHGVDLTAFDEAHDPTIEEPLLLSVGRLCDTKGFPELIEACRLLRERGVAFSCRIVGDGYMREELERQIRESALEGVVTIAGLLPRAAVRDLYRRARLFVLPCVVTPRGDRDGLPNVIVEAMAMGLPVVASNISGIPEAVVEGETGRLTPPHDPEALAEAIQSLWEDPALRARMGRAGHARACERFGLEQNVALLAALTHRESRTQVSDGDVR